MSAVIVIETLNHWGSMLLPFAWPMLWQSSVLIIIVWGLDQLLARRIRAAVRYALLLVILVKLLLPPALALPTGATWWFVPTQPPARGLAPVAKSVTVTYDQSPPLLDLPSPALSTPAPFKPKLTPAGWTLASSLAASTILLLHLGFHWWHVRRIIWRANSSEKFAAVLAEAAILAGVRAQARTGALRVRLKVTDDLMSPAVCGLLRPVILLPRALAEHLSREQLRTVLLHELFHLRRRDVWVNCAQALLQIGYWWHPLLWLANARIRRLREEAVDDAVMLALRDDADNYVPTLLAVARLALQRPLLSLGLVGIMESRSALRQRVERLLDFHAPRKAGLTFASLCGICVFSAVALPMGGKPPGQPLPNTSIQFAGSSIQTTNPGATGNATNTAGQLGKIPDGLTTATGRPLPMRVTDATDARARTFAKLDQIRLKSVTYDHLPLVDVLRQLSDELKRLDPERTGVNFMWDANDSTTTNLPLINIPKLVDVRLIDLLDAIVLVASHPVHYHVLPDGAVLFSTPDHSERLFMRTFRINPAALKQASDGIPRQQPDLITAHNTSAPTTSRAAMDFFSALGIDWQQPNGKSVMYNERLGMLFVKATEADLDTIERALQTLQPLSASPLIHVKIRFFAVPRRTTTFFDSYKNISISPTNFFTAILTAGNAETVLHQLRSAGGCDVLDEPEGTTTSGWQMHLPLMPKTETDIVYDVVVRKPAENVRFLNIIPYVLSDGYTINLAVIPGAVQPTFNRNNTANASPAAQTMWTNPGIRTVNLLDGQTMVMGELPAPDFFSQIGIFPNPAPDKVLLVFVTATLVDSDGNRVHTDEEMPSSQTGVPPQY